VIYRTGGGTAITLAGSPDLVDGTTYFIKTITGADITLAATSGGATLDIDGTGNNAQYFFAKPLRYYQITYTMLSATGESSPLITGASISYMDTSITPVNGYYDIAGIGPHVYTDPLATRPRSPRRRCRRVSGGGGDLPAQAVLDHRRRCDEVLERDRLGRQRS